MSASGLKACLWFDREAEDAARHYAAIFPNSAIGAISRYGKGAPLPEGTALTVSFTLDGREFMALNGGPVFTFTEAVSFVVDCATQAEVDYYWDRLSAGGAPGQCGWLKDRYGLSWQVVPTILPALMTDADPARVNRVMQALMGMTKLDIQALRDAHEHD